MDARDYYFKMMVRCIYSAKYVYLQYLRHHRRRRWIDAALAVLSGGCLAAWLLHRDFAAGYATVIVLSQIISAVLPYFEVYRHDEALAKASLGCQWVKRQAEGGWLRINARPPSDEETMDMARFLQAELAVVLDPVLAEGIDRDDRIGRKASLETDAYVKDAYLGGD